MILPAFFLLAGLAAPQDLPPVSAATDYARLHEGVNPPKLLHSRNPDYTPQALQAGIEGSVVLQAVIDVSGNVAYASVLSPLPAGLDAKALAAVKTWRYTPGVMDGEIIPVLTTIDVVFRLPYILADPIAEEHRQALRQLSTLSSPAPNDVKALKQLASENIPAAVGLLAEWHIKGVGMPKNEKLGNELLKRAADGNDARSLFLLGNLQRAAFFGYSGAQFDLGDQNEHAGNRNEAMRYFRMCAAAAHPNCQYRLGKLLVSGPNTNPNDFTQGVTWLELAKEHGDRNAASLWTTSAAKLSSIQLEWVRQLKPHLELKNFHGF